MALSFTEPGADVFVPDGTAVDAALRRTTHLAVGAHPDDLEVMAAHPILECFGNERRWFTGLIVSDGSSSARAFEYRDYSDERMTVVRSREQRKAAYVGEYSALVELRHPSTRVKDAADSAIVSDLTAVLQATRPELLYTHNLADEHDTHVAVALRVVEACRALPADARPQRVIGCEVWRDLDWLCRSDKVVMPVDQREHLQTALLGVYDSQIAGGKRYDLATAGRRRAHATYHDAHATDRHQALIFGMDLTPLLEGADPIELVRTYIARFEADVTGRVARLSRR